MVTKDLKTLNLKFDQVMFNPIWHGGRAMMAPQNVFDHCAQTLRTRKLKLGDFYINLFSIKKSYFWFPRFSSVTIATSLSGGTLDFLKLSFHMFPYNEILKVFRSKIWVDIWENHLKIPPNTKFQRNQSGSLGVTSIWNLRVRIG